MRRLSLNWIEFWPPTRSLFLHWFDNFKELVAYIPAREAFARTTADAHYRGKSIRPLE
jgi:hypothetical protein